MKRRRSSPTPRVLVIRSPKRSPVRSPTRARCPLAVVRIYALAVAKSPARCRDVDAAAAPTRACRPLVSVRSPRRARCPLLLSSASTRSPSRKGRRGVGMSTPRLRPHALAARSFPSARPRVRAARSTLSARRRLHLSRRQDRRGVETSGRTREQRITTSNPSSTRTSLPQCLSVVSLNQIEIGIENKNTSD